MSHSFADPTCPVCKGEGFRPADASEDDGQAILRFRMCRCTYQNILLDKLRHINPELMSCGQGYEGTTDLLPDRSNNVQFIGPYKLVLKNIRLFLIRVLLDSEFRFTCRFLTDLQLKEMWFGIDDKGAVKSLDGGMVGLDDESTPAVKLSLDQEVRNPDLLFLVLGHMSYKNIALPGMVLEALKSRSFRGQPTWVYLPHALGNTDLYYSYEVEQHLNAFKKLIFKSSGGSATSVPVVQQGAAASSTTSSISSGLIDTSLLKQL